MDISDQFKVLQLAYPWAYYGTDNDDPDFPEIDVENYDGEALIIADLGPVTGTDPLNPDTDFMTITIQTTKDNVVWDDALTIGPWPEATNHQVVVNIINIDNVKKIRASIIKDFGGGFYDVYYFASITALVHALVSDPQLNSKEII